MHRSATSPSPGNLFFFWGGRTTAFSCKEVAEALTDLFDSKFDVLSVLTEEVRL